MKYFLVALLVFPAALALQFSAPTILSYTGTSNITFVWDEYNVTLDVNGVVENVSENNISREFVPGNYVVTVSKDNQSATLNLTVSSQLALNVTTDKASYEAGASARIRVATSQPTQLNLNVSRDGSVIDTYTINVQQQTDFLYVLSAVGTYTISASAAGVSSTATCTAINTTMSASISGGQSATAGRIVSYGSSVIGGAPPYLYNWQFSDGTTSSGKNADHVFSDPGNYTITLVVSDSLNRQASATTGVNVIEQLSSFDVSVLDQANKLLVGALVTISDGRVGRSLTTDIFGEARFRNLTDGNYSVNTTYNDTRVSPAVKYTDTRIVQITTNTDVTIHMSVPGVAATSTANATAPINNTTSNNSTAPLTSTANATAPDTQTTQSAASAAQALAAAPTAEEQASQLFEQKRQDAIDEIRAAKNTITRSDEKQQLLTYLGKMKVYEESLAEAQSATTEATLNSALESIPRDVVILVKDTTITKPTSKDIEEDMQAFFVARGISKEDEKKYRYNIESLLGTTTITSKRTVSRITYRQNQETYTLYTRTASVPVASSFFEFIPKSVAADASALMIDGSHEVVQADPVVRFLSSSYSYAVSGESNAVPSVLAVPLELEDPPGILGFAAVKLQFGDFDKSGLYMIVLVAILGVIVGGNIYLRRVTTSSLPNFIELTNVALSGIENNQEGLIAKYADELKAIHATLSLEEQKETSDIMLFITDMAMRQRFKSAANHVHVLITINDTNGLPAAYENAISQYEALSEELQQKEQETLQTLLEAIEQS